MYSRDVTQFDNKVCGKCRIILFENKRKPNKDLDMPTFTGQKVK